MTSALSDVAIRDTASPTAAYLRASGGVERAIAAGPETLGRIGSLETRLVRDGDELRAAQSIRFKVFYEELGAHRTDVHALDDADSDRFDDICDHLIVLDRELPGNDEAQIVGTYRLLRQEVAERSGGFYTADEFEIGALIARHPGKNFLELGRSCVLPQYRSKRTIELLWQGIWAYCLRHRIDVMTGCASFHGTVPAAHALALTFLHNRFAACGDWYARALPHRRVEMDLMPAEALDERAALSTVPPLIKGYLRLGAKIGDGAVIDAEFGTTDVLVILPVSTISPRYVNYYGADASRFA